MAEERGELGGRREVGVGRIAMVGEKGMAELAGKWNLPLTPLCIGVLGYPVFLEQKWRLGIWRQNTLYNIKAVRL